MSRRWNPRPDEDERSSNGGAASIRFVETRWIAGEKAMSVSGEQARQCHRLLPHPQSHRHALQGHAIPLLWETIQTSPMDRECRAASTSRINRFDRRQGHTSKRLVHDRMWETAQSPVRYDS